MAPDYITDLLTPYEPECGLRSSSRGLLVIPRSRLKTRGDRAFGVRKRLWNDLPKEIRQASSVSSFKSFSELLSHESVILLFLLYLFLLFTVGPHTVVETKACLHAVTKPDNKETHQVKQKESRRISTPIMLCTTHT